jgi:DNA-binding XRE family transcriptional regulator
MGMIASPLWGSFVRSRLYHSESPVFGLQENVLRSKGVIRAANNLGISQKALAPILGVSESTVSRIRNGTFVLKRSTKTFDICVLFVRFYLLLDAIVGGDEAVARAWLNNRNEALQGRPIDLLKSVCGLVSVVQYLDQRTGR